MLGGVTGAGAAMAAGGAADSKPIGVQDALPVMDIPAAASAGDSTTARTRALAQARRRAFERLLRDLSSSSDHDQLPRLDDRTVENMVLSFEIRQEKRSSTDYRARSDWYFDIGKIRTLFEDADIPYTLSAAASMVVIPVFRYAGADILWEKDNLWHQAWRAMPSSLLQPLVLPKGDFGDMMAINPYQALSNDCAALRAMMRRYSSGGFLIAVAKPRIAADGSVAVGVDVRRDARGVGPKRLIFDVRDAVSLDEALQAAVVEVQRALGDEWKRLHAVSDADIHHPIRIEANFTTLAQWLAMKHSLESLSRRMTIQALSAKKAWLEIMPRGDINAFQYNVMAQGWMIRGQDGVWNIQANADDTPPEWGAC